MGGIAVKRFGGNDCGKDPKHHLSLVCPANFSVFAKFDLPFDRDEQVDSGSCDGLLYFQGEKGKIVIINLRTEEMKVIDPPYFKPPPHTGFLRASGLGYDHKSKDYKLIRTYVQYNLNEEDEERYCGHKAYFQLYSFKCGEWTDIPKPDAGITYPTGLYLKKTGRCYWTALLEIGGLPNDPWQDHVLSFDFTTERFGHFTLPATTTGESGDPHARYKLVECHGSLGVLVYWGGPHADMPSSSSPLSIEFFVRKGRSWQMLYDVVTLDHHVRRPLGLRDGRLLFLEVECSRRFSQLMVYNLGSRESEKLSTYDFRGNMTTTCYVESAYILPDSEPITMVPYVESSDPPPPDSSEDKERKIAIERMLKKMRRGKGRMKIRRGKRRTVSKNKPHSRKRPRPTTFICESSLQQ